MNGSAYSSSGGSRLLVRVGLGDASATVVLSGRLDAVEAPALREKLDVLIQEGRSQLLVDLSDVSFIDSAGLAVLVRARRITGTKGGEVVLVQPSSHEAQRVFRLTQFDQVFRTVPKPGQ